MCADGGQERATIEESPRTIAGKPASTAIQNLPLVAPTPLPDPSHIRGGVDITITVSEDDTWSFVLKAMRGGRRCRVIPMISLHIFTLRDQLVYDKIETEDTVAGSVDFPRRAFRGVLRGAFMV